MGMIPVEMSPMDWAVFSLMAGLLLPSKHHALDNLSKSLLTCGGLAVGFLYVWYRLSSFSCVWETYRP